jgi:hypothetical protein
LGQRRRGGKHKQTTAQKQPRNRTEANTDGGGKNTHEETFQEKLTDEKLFLRL